MIIDSNTHGLRLSQVVSHLPATGKTVSLHLAHGAVKCKPVTGGL